MTLFRAAMNAALLKCSLRSGQVQGKGHLTNAQRCVHGIGPGLTHGQIEDPCPSGRSSTIERSLSAFLMAGRRRRSGTMILRAQGKRPNAADALRAIAHLSRDGP